MFNSLFSGIKARFAERRAEKFTAEADKDSKASATVFVHMVSGQVFQKTITATGAAWYMCGSYSSWSATEAIRMIFQSMCVKAAVKGLTFDDEHFMPALIERLTLGDIKEE